MHVVRCPPISLLTCTADQVVRSHPLSAYPVLSRLEKMAINDEALLSDTLCRMSGTEFTTLSLNLT